MGQADLGVIGGQGRMRLIDGCQRVEEGHILQPVCILAGNRCQTVSSHTLQAEK